MIRKTCISFHSFQEYLLTVSSFTLQKCYIPSVILFLLANCTHPDGARGSIVAFPLPRRCQFYQIDCETLCPYTKTQSYTSDSL